MKKRIIAIAVAVIVAATVGWRFWPCSVASLGAPEAESVVELSVYGMIGTFENGETSHSYYRMDTEETVQIQEVLNVLNASDYQQDFRNLWPWGVDSVGADKNYDSRTVHVDFSFGDAYISIQFLSPSIVAVSSSEWSGFRIYHPTDRETFYNMVEYLKTHNAPQ